MKRIMLYTQYTLVFEKFKKHFMATFFFSLSFLLLLLLVFLLVGYYIFLYFFLFFHFVRGAFNEKRDKVAT